MSMVSRVVWVALGALVMGLARQHLGAGSHK